MNLSLPNEFFLDKFYNLNEFFFIPKMLLGMLLCISFSKAVTRLAIDGDRGESKDFSNKPTEILTATRFGFYYECKPKEIDAFRYWVSLEKTESVSIKFESVVNAKNECLLSEYLNILKNANFEERNLIKLEVSVQELSKNHLNIIKEFSFIEELSFFCSTVVENLDFSFKKLGQNIKKTSTLESTI